MKAATVGDNCMDVYLSRQESYPGGNPVNVAVYLKRLGADASYIGWVGTDDYGGQMRRALRDKGIDVGHLHQQEGQTAVTYVELIGSDRQFGDYHEGVMEHFRLTEADLRFIEGHALVHAGIWGHAEPYFPRFKEKGLITSFDFSDKLHHDLTRQLPAFVDYAFYSYTQDDAYIRSYLKETHAIGARVAVATLGENGSLAYDGERYFRREAEAVTVVDTMGAGDSFIAGFLYGIMNGLPLTQCLEQGTRSAAQTITYFGAW